MQSRYDFICPNCGLSRMNMLDYESLMVLRPDLGLFTIKCGNCHMKTSLLRPIPNCLRTEVAKAAAELRAGMGNVQG